MEFKIDYKQFWQFNNIKRYSIRLNQTYTENDTEHSFFVAVILARLMSHFKYDNFNLLKFALIHDTGELITGDINTHCKTDALRKELQKLEQPAIEAFMKFLAVEPISETDEALLKAADVLTTYFYGKVNSVDDIRISGFKRFKSYLKKFKELRQKSSGKL